MELILSYLSTHLDDLILDATCNFLHNFSFFFKQLRSSWPNQIPAAYNLQNDSRIRKNISVHMLSY